MRPEGIDVEMTTEERNGSTFGGATDEDGQTSGRNDTEAERGLYAPRHAVPGGRRPERGARSSSSDMKSQSARGVSAWLVITAEYSKVPSSGANCGQRLRLRSAPQW
jgi:hypothetical protein